jgi:hypothetical protein
VPLVQRVPLMLSIESCVVVLPSWLTVASARHTSSFCRSSADILVVVRGGSRRIVEWSSRVSCGLACRHEPMSFVEMHTHTPGMVYPLHTTRYSGHCRSSDAEVLYE